MPQPLEFEFEVAPPIDVPGFLDAYAATVARVSVPAIGETFLSGPEGADPRRVQHVHALGDGDGGLFPEEVLITPQLTRFAGPAILPQIRAAYAAPDWVEADSGLYATLPIPGAASADETRMFRYRSSNGFCSHLAYARLDVNAYYAGASLSLPPWFLTRGIAELGFSPDGVATLLKSVFAAFVDLKRVCPGGGKSFRIARPGGNLLPELDRLAEQLKTEAG